MSRSRLLAALGAAGLAAIPATAMAAGTISHAKLWQNTSGAVICGIMRPLPKQPASQILCGAQGLPHVKGGDPYVRISAHGRPRIVPISQDSYITSHTTTLKPGSHWSALGVTCTIAAKSARCHNRSGHGFTLATDRYKAF